MKRKDNYLFILVLLFPFIDFLTGMFSWNKTGFSIGLIVRGLFLGYVLFKLLKNTKDKKIFLLLGFYFITYFLYLLLNHKNLGVELINITKIFYLPILILFFANSDNLLINKKTCVYIFSLYALLYLIPFLLGIGHNAHEIAPNRELYLSYFYMGNELANVFILLIPIVISYLLESNSRLLKVIYTLIIICLLVLMGTKAFYLSMIATLIYFLIVNRKKIIPFIKKNYLATLVTIVVVLIALIVYIPRLDFTKSFKATLDYYQVSSLTNLFSLENIDHVLFNSRLTYLKNIHQTYLNSNSLEKLFGLGKEQIALNKEIEIDIFDLFYSIGLIGFAFYIIFCCYVLKRSSLKGIYKYAFILILIVSCFTGHFLMSPFVSTIMAIIFLASKNTNPIKQTKILLVSNMYPNSKYPHYGIFVKNVYDLLVRNNYDVDCVVLTKMTQKYQKIINYIKFYVSSFWKSLWNNYDYIYVHFISHSTLGVYLPYLTSKNVQLVLNVHGNDIIADNPKEHQNEQRSRFYLRHADQVIAPSAYFQKILITKYQVPASKITIYPSGGVDLQVFKKLNKKEAIKELGLKSGIKYFGYVARLEKDKGYDILIKAINELKNQKKLTKIKFIIVGSGKEEEKLDNLIHQYKLAKYIIRIPLLAQEKLVYVYNAIEALIYPVRRKSESLGLTGLEAMACETIVIGSNLYGPSTYLVDNQNSLTFNANDYQELVSKIEVVLKMKAKDKKAMQHQAYLTSLEYSKENTQKIILKVFKK